MDGQKDKLSYRADVQWASKRMREDIINEKAFEIKVLLRALAALRVNNG